MPALLVTVTTCAQCVAGSSTACDSPSIILVALIALGAFLFGLTVLTVERYLRH